jgi:hypothetical protein
MVVLKGDAAATEQVETKHIGALEIKDAEKGEVEAVVATLGVVDRDGDVIREDAVKNGMKVKMSEYGHSIVYGGGGAPVGKGTLHVEGKHLVFKGKMFLATARGRDAFHVLKEMGSDQEWSFGFIPKGSEVPDEEWRKKGAHRIITKLAAFEVSPVAIGAGIGTRTLAVKEKEADPPPAPLAPAEPSEEEKAQAAEAERVAREAELKAAKELADAAAEEFARFQRTSRRLSAA